jgi:hypothetical protein
MLTKEHELCCFELCGHVIEIVGSFSQDFQLLQLQGTCLSFGLGYSLFIASNCTCVHLILICCVIIFGSLILYLFMLTYDDILCPK